MNGAEPASRDPRLGRQRLALMAGALVMILVAFGATWHLGRVHGAQVEERTREPVASGNAAQGDHDRVRCSSAASADPSSPTVGRIGS